MKSIGRTLAVMVCGLIAHTSIANEGDAPAVDSASLSLTPARCVALHQGQTCYQRVQIDWQSASAGDYCIYFHDSPQPLHCWQQQMRANFLMEFAEQKSRTLQLKTADQRVIADATFEVVWVYKANTRRKTHWRLF